MLILDRGDVNMDNKIAQFKNDKLPEKEGLPSLKEGDLDPFLGKKVRVLIVTHENYNVYLDEALCTQWYGRISDDKDISTALNKLSKLESCSHFITEEKILKPIRQQIAEGLVRALEGHKELSNEMFKLIEKEISLRNLETSWLWYFLGSGIPALISLIILIIFWIFRIDLRQFFGIIAFTVAICAMVGGLGAFLSIASRSTKISLDARAGITIHVTEGLARIITGLFAGALIVLLTKGGVAFYALKTSGSSLATLLAFSLMAGSSERVIPNLVKKHETDLK
ncbi:hypothetical protein QN379_00230 [Glaciimonas sp. Gout2]|uniref:hypothetical protein n=1 Tax=Glaciimonas sp. Gout2 TaxID=3048625 RepID=UPI002B23ADF4|nr:hypothetical protein [Glaciimonas sp. Gout2]MEB0080445.1 hypothetical protein [Glaciimonas sp. Gout2]